MNKNDHLNKGFRHFSGEEFDAAIESFERALEIDPQFDLALNALAQVYNRKGNVDKAIEIARKLIAIKPQDAVAHAALSRLYVQKGMIDEAEKELAISNELASKK